MEVKFPPEIEAFIAERVESGAYPSVDDMLLAALEQLRLAEHELPEEIVRELEAADAQIEAGDYVEFDELAAAMRKKYGP
jgi:Arc/MetJ-type ribon-helix-helix transcriptional regulator